MSKKTSGNRENDIAIIGMACRFPGANNYNEFWENLENGVDSIKEIPPERWDINKYYSPDIDEPNKSISKWCGLVDDFDRFDNEFFTISPREAAWMDPQQRILLEETWHCVEDSGVSVEELQQKRTSVYMGAMALDNLNQGGGGAIRTDAYSAIGSYSGILANRVSHMLDLSGESHSLDAACASSLVAMHAAKQAILARQADYALAGAVSLNFHPFKYISFSKSRMLSPDGQCKTFDKEANGYAPGDGAAVLLLRRLADARESGNHIHGVIKGSAVNYTAGKSMITAPSVDAQRDVISSAYKDADIQPENITYIEAHGTGTSLGDPVEVEALTLAFKENTEKHAFCKIGSVKTNIGHAEAAAGMAGVIKVLLMMKHKKIPPSLNLKTVNPVIDFGASPFSVAVELSEWKTDSPFLAGVSSFGMGGVNSHLVLEEPPLKELKQERTKQPLPFLFSAKSEASLLKLIDIWKRFVQTEDCKKYSLDDISGALAAGRESFPFRFGCMAESHDELRNFLNAAPDAFPKLKKPSLCLRIGEHHWKGWEEIQPHLEYNSFFKHEIERVEAIFEKSDVTKAMSRGLRGKTWAKENYTLYRFMTGLAFLNSFFYLSGVRPDLVTGEAKNSGLWTALTISGMIKCEDALALLAGEKKNSDIEFARPTIPFFDPVFRKSIHPFHFSAEYLNGLLDNLKISKEATDHYFSKTRSLLENQFTFKKYMEEWDAALDKTGVDLRRLWDGAEGLPGKDKKLFSVISANCIRKLNRKWNLSEKRMAASPEFYEIVDLITDKVLPKKKAVALLRDEHPDVDAVVDILNRNQGRIDTTNPYKIIRNRKLDEIGGVARWLERVGNTIIVDPENMLCFDFGSLNAFGSATDSVSGDMNDEPAVIPKKTMLELWLKGVDVDFKKRRPDGVFQKVPLPVYPFKGERHRLPKVEGPEVGGRRSEVGGRGSGIGSHASGFGEPGDAPPLQPSSVHPLDTPDKSGWPRPSFRLNAANHPILLYGDDKRRSAIPPGKQPSDAHRRQAPKPAGISLGDSASFQKKDADDLKKTASLVLSDPSEGAISSNNDRPPSITAISLHHYEHGVYRLQCRGEGHTSKSICRGIEKSVEIMERDPRAHAVILDGRDVPFFSLESDVGVALKICHALTECTLPVIAVMNGGADTTGMMTGLCSDIMILGEESRYRYRPEDANGVIDKKRQFALISQRVGVDRATEWTTRGLDCTGKELNVEGMTIRVVAESDVSLAVEALVDPLIRGEGSALRILKRHLHRDIRSAFTGGPPTIPGEALKPHHHADPWVQSMIDLPAARKGVIRDRSTERFGPSTEVAIDSGVMKLKRRPRGILVVEMRDPKSKNTFSEAFTKGVIDVFEHIKANDAYKVVIITGYDQYFACGGTREGLLDIYEGKSKFSDIRIYASALECSIPVIAAMQGHAIGAGWSMGMFCDFTIFSEESVYTSNYMRYGFTPGAGATLIFPERFGGDFGREILFTANEYKGRDLRARGVLHPVLAREDVLPLAMGVAEQLADASREQLMRAKQRGVQTLRDRIETVVERELSMHEKTFVGNERVLENILREYNRGEKAAAAPVDSASRSSHPSTLSDASETVAAFSTGGFENLREKLRSMLAEELYTRAEKIEDDIKFVDMGLDSIIGVQWVRKIGEEFGLSILATKVYNYPTIRTFTEYVMTEGRKQGIFHEKREDVGAPAPPEGKTSAPSPAPTPTIRSPRPLNPSARNIRRGGGIRDVADAKKESLSIAIIGMSGRFPKSGNVAQFWDVIRNKVNCIEEVPAHRWDMAKYFDEDPRIPGKSYCKWMGLLDGVDRFDPLFFHISPREAQSMDPQQRLFLEQSWACLEDAGYSPESLSGSRCGVFAGCGAGDYLQHHTSQMLTAEGFIGGSASILAGRLSYLLNLHGPCLSIDTACSSSLVAIAEACNSLASGASDVAIAGGVCVLAGPTMHIRTSKARMLSRDGRCFVFDNRANGFVPGEGVGVVALKRLSDAEKDHDNIHGVIRGWGVNHDGKTNGITAPGQDSQIRLEKEIYDKNGIDPGEIQLVEAHGTGTKLGDPIEVEALVESFRSYTEKKNYCALGSVKSNIGHLITAAGVAGVIKTVMALKHRRLPPTINFEHVNEHIQLENSPFYVNTEDKEWSVDAGKKRRAAVSSFGFSGTNAHVVIEEYIESAGRGANGAGRGAHGAGRGAHGAGRGAHGAGRGAHGAGRGAHGAGRGAHGAGRGAHGAGRGARGEGRGAQSVPQIIVLSAKTEERLKAYAQNLHTWLQQRQSTPEPRNSESLNPEPLNPEPRNSELRTQNSELRTQNSEPQNSESLNYSAANYQRSELQRSELLAPSGSQPQSTDPQQFLSSIAYTLQVGREAMEERLALVATSLNELAEKLKRFIDGENNIDDLYRGNVKRNKEALAVFEADAELMEAVDKWIERKKYSKLLTLWVKGLTFDWNKLYGGAEPRRISLPTYPFAKERYWIDAVEGGASGGEGEKTIAKLHSLLHENTSDLAGPRFSSTFTGDEFFLADHVVNGKRLLPGVAYLEMARAAVERTAGVAGSGRANIVLKNVVWARPIVVDGRPIHVHIALSPEESGEIAYEMYTKADETDAEPRVHCQGAALLNTPDEAPALDIASLKAQCDLKRFTSEECYDFFSTIGLEYGPGHRGIEEVHVGSDRVLARLSLPIPASDAGDRFFLHPGLMDSALQASMALILDIPRASPAPTHHRSPITDHQPLPTDHRSPITDHQPFTDHRLPALPSDHRTGPPLPFALDELEIYGRPSSAAWALVRKNGDARSGIRKLDLDLCNENGAVFARMKGFTSRVQSGETRPSDILMFTPSWREEALDARANPPDYEKHVVALCEPDDALRQKISGRIKGKISGVEVVILESKEKNIDTRFGACARRLFETIQSLLAARPKGNTLLQVVLPAQKDRRLFSCLSGLSGLLKTAHMENPRCIGQVIETDDDARIQAILEENRGRPYDGHIKYMNGKRFVAHLQEIESGPDAPDVPWKDNGVYLITGGAGGLGLIFAREITGRTRRAAVILAGRSELDAEKERRLKEMRSAGARVEYRRADVTRGADVAHLLKGIEKEFGAVNGVVHAAGVIHDDFIIKKTTEAFEKVLAPKVTGLVNLDEATRDLPLDFFILFSSIAGVMGNPGQADYACANAFMDAYADYRNDPATTKQRGGKTLSIIWPLWKEGRMRVDEETEKMIEKNTGMIPMRTHEGIHALHRSFSSGKSRVIVMEGDAERIRQRLGAIPRSPKPVKTSAFAPLETMARSKSGKEQTDVSEFLKSRMVAHLKRLVSNSLGIDPNRIETDKSLEAYGLDSVVVLDIFNELEKHFPDLSRTLFFEYSGIDELAEYFVVSHKETLIALFEPNNTADQGNNPEKGLRRSDAHPDHAPRTARSKPERATHPPRPHGKKKARTTRPKTPPGRKTPIQRVDRERVAEILFEEAKNNYLSIDDIIRVTHADIITSEAVDPG